MRKKMRTNTGGETRDWKDLERDVLSTICKKLDFIDLIKGAPLCCTSWYEASKDPCVWRHINLGHFRKHRGRSVPATQLIEFVIGRSQGSLTSITFPSNTSVDDLLLVAERCPKLKHFNLRIPESNVLEGMKKISRSISKLKELEGIAVNEVFISDDSTLKQISQCCPQFIKLKVYDSLSKNTASLIATSLPKLKFLDLSSTTIHREDLLVILKGCDELENLDITDCGKVYGSDEILKIGCRRIKEFKWDDEVNDSCSMCEEESDDSYQWPCEHVQDDGFTTYIDGTMDLIDHLFPPEDEITYEHPDFVSDGDVASDASHEHHDYWDCCDCGGLSSDSDDGGNNADFIREAYSL